MCAISDSAHLHATFIYLRFLPGLLVGFLNVALTHSLRPSYVIVRPVPDNRLAGIVQPGCSVTAPNSPTSGPDSVNSSIRSGRKIVVDQTRSVPDLRNDLPLPFEVQGERVDLLVRLGRFNRRASATVSSSDLAPSAPDALRRAHIRQNSGAPPS